MNDNDIIKALEDATNPLKDISPEGASLIGIDTLLKALDLINRQQAEIERLQKLQKPTETSGFKIENGKVVFYTNILNGYRHEYKDLEEIAKELNLMLQSCYKCDEVVSHYKGNLKTAKAEAVKKFGEKITEVFMRYAHLHNYADQARAAEVESADGTKIELFSVWDVLTLKKHGMAEYEEMGELQHNIEYIANDRLLTELEKDFHLLVKEMTEQSVNYGSSKTEQ